MTTDAGRRRWALDAGLALVLALTAIRYVGNGTGPVTGSGDLVRELGRRGPPVGPVVTAVWGDPFTAVALAVLCTAPLAVRRRYPLVVLWIVSAAAAPTLRINPDVVFVASIAVGVAIYSAAAHSPHRSATLCSLPVPALLLVALFQHAALPDLPKTWVGTLLLIPIGVAAIGIRVRRRGADRDRDRAARALQAAGAEERARIARELHDVVTHHVSVMVIQAAAARRVLDVAPDDAREALLAVESAGRTALGELRGVLGLLGATGSGSAPELAPQPGLDALPELVDRLRDAGVPVDYTVLGEPRPVPDGIGLTAYRVAQEALTNAVRHAAGATATVVLEYATDQLRIEVTDAGTDATAGTVPAAGGPGYGLAGLRERVAVYGGTLEAGRRLTGGYRVRARLPLAAS